MIADCGPGCSIELEVSHHLLPLEWVYVYCDALQDVGRAVDDFGRLQPGSSIVPTSTLSLSGSSSSSGNVCMYAASKPVVQIVTLYPIARPRHRPAM